MNEQMRARILAGVAIVTLAVLSLLAGGDARGQQECSADVRASLSGKEQRGTGVEWTFRVDVSSSASCADVGFALIVDERTRDGKTTERRIGFRKRVQSRSSKSRVVRYTEVDGVSLQRWRFESTSCSPCPR